MQKLTYNGHKKETWSELLRNDHIRDEVELLEIMEARAEAMENHRESESETLLNDEMRGCEVVVGEEKLVVVGELQIMNRGTVG